MPEWAAQTPWWVVVGLVITLVMTIVKISRWTQRVDASIGSVNNRIDSLAKTLQEGLAEVRADIRKILHWQASKTIESESPLRLTEIGRKVSDILDIPSVAEKLLPMLRTQTDGKHPYDIQERCFEYARDEYRPSPEFDARIKQCAYDNGLDRNEVLDVLAIVLRDKLLKIS